MPPKITAADVQHGRNDPANGGSLAGSIGFATQGPVARMDAETPTL